MTQKEKAKAYDEALERAKEVYHRGYYVSGDIEYIFPELAESEDERIRKALIRYHQSTLNIDGVKGEDILAWLEKLGDKDKLIQELGEYKVKYTQEVLEKHLKTINKDDERLRKTTIAFLKDFAEQGYENAVECIDWLEKQGYNWKPSKGQISALEHFVRGIEESGFASPYDSNTNLLNSLINDLRKLEKQGDTSKEVTCTQEADGLPIWENDTVKVTHIDHPDTYFLGEVVWMQTCFGVEDEKGHTTPLCQLRACHHIEVTGNKFEGL